jgi:hypothetical protein
MDGITNIMMGRMYYMPCPIMGQIPMAPQVFIIGRFQIQSVLLEPHFFIQVILLVVPQPFKEYVSQQLFGIIYMRIIILTMLSLILHLILPTMPERMVLK